jgi:threonine dehydrogenase-like Zn-dependent dehydrogenase
VGVCGTDVEFFTGEMAYPLRPGHEWCGVVASAGDGAGAAWLGRRVTGDTRLAWVRRAGAAGPGPKVHVDPRSTFPG